MPNGTYGGVRGGAGNDPTYSMPGLDETTRGGGAMIFFSEGYLSELLRMNVVDGDGTFIGRIGDIGVKLGESFPLVTKIVLHQRRRREPLILPWGVVRSVSTEAV